MTISYILTLEELAVLAYFSGCEKLIGFSSLPVIEAKRCEEVLNELQDKGMVSIIRETVAVTPPLRMIMRLITRPFLSVQSPTSIWAHCDTELGLILGYAPHSKTRLRIMPLPTAREVAEEFWRIGGICFESCELILYREGVFWQQPTLSQQELRTVLEDIYREE